MIAFVFGNLFAQSYDFDQYNVGDKVAAAIGQPWTTWSDEPGSDEDAVFSDEQAASGTNSVKFTYGNDQIYNFNDETTGSYTLDWNMYIPTGKDAHLNIQHNFTGGQDGEWAFGLYFNTTDQGTILHVSDAEYPFTFPFDTWFPVHFDIDLDNDAISLTIDGTEVHSWAFSESESSTTPGMRVLDALDFFPPTNASKSVFYIDDFSFVSSQEDEILLFDPFEEYTVGNHIAEDAIAHGYDHWTTWNNHPGTNEDGFVVEQGGSKCGEISGVADNVLLLGDEENGNYDLEFDILVPEGSNGYFNILHRFAGSNSKWAMQCYLHLTNDGDNSTVAPGQGTIHAGSNGTATLTNLPFDAWMHFRLNVNTDTDEANFYYTAPGEEEVLVCTWQWSLDSFGNNTIGRTLAAMDFFAPMEDGSSIFYLDNFSFKKLGGESAPQISFDPDEINVELMEDDVTTMEVEIINDGNSIGDWAGWLDFGQGGDGSQTSDLYYHNGEEAQGIGSDDSYSREIGIRLPASLYAGAAMGMRIVSAQYLVGTQYQAADHNYTFRIYGQGLHNQPGELLAEKTINSAAAGEWITATFDEPIYMTGQAMWATVALEQNGGEYPLSMDAGAYGEEQDGNWLSTNGNSFNHCYAAPSGTSDGFEGAWLITVNCEGELVPGTWVNVDKTEGSIMGGQSETLTLTLNSIGLAMGMDYTANLVINTNDVNVPHVEIPINLAVADGVEETVAQLASIYPNPATSVVTLQGENLNSLAIYNVAGQLLRVVKLDNMVNTIDMNVEAGVYFFSVYDNNGRNSVQRVVITK